MEVLLEDFDRWVNNVYKYQNEIRKIKRDITIGIVISMLLALLTTVMCNMLNMFAKEPLSITSTAAYQGISVLFVLLCIVFYTFTRKHYGFDWIGTVSYTHLDVYKRQLYDRCCEWTEDRVLS